MRKKDALVVVHAEEFVMKIKKKEELPAFQAEISKRIAFYLYSGKRVFFTRIGRGDSTPEYLKNFGDKITYIPHTKFHEVYDQGNQVRKSFDRNISDVEVIGGYEFACLRETVRGILSSANLHSIKREYFDHKDVFYSQTSGGVNCHINKGLTF